LRISKEGGRSMRHANRKGRFIVTAVASATAVTTSIFKSEATAKVEPPKRPRFFHHNVGSSSRSHRKKAKGQNSCRTAGGSVASLDGRKVQVQVLRQVVYECVDGL